MTNDELRETRRSNLLAAALVPTLFVMLAVYFFLTESEPGGKITLLVILCFVIWVPQMIFLIGHAWRVQRRLLNDPPPSHRS